MFLTNTETKLITFNYIFVLYTTTKIHKVYVILYKNKKKFYPYLEVLFMSRVK